MIRSNIFRRLAEHEGQALIEFILVLPIIFLLIVNLVNFGGFFYAWITVANAARAGANYAIEGPSSVSGPGATLSAPTVAQITSVIQNDTSSLPSAVSVNICQNKNGTVTTQAGTCTSVPSDPEPSVYTLTTVDVTYTYSPFIPVFSFPRLGVFLTIPPTTVVQRAEMRQIL